MANVTQGLRGTVSYPASQRPGSFRKGIKLTGSRVSREDVARHMREVHKNIPSTVKRAKAKGKKKEAMLRAIAFSKARHGK